MLRGIAVFFVFVVLGYGTVQATSYNKNNFGGRQALVINDNPYIRLSEFSFGNVDGRNYRSEFRQNLKWTNISKQPVVSFEIVIIKYDPFGRNLIGSRWLVNGHDSANWQPLPPGGSAKDGTIGRSEEDVFTAFAYIRYVRLANGKIWSADIQKVSQKIAQLAPSIRDVGDIDPSVKRDGNKK